MDMLLNLNWSAIFETFLADFSVALIMAIVGALFLNRYVSKLNFSRRLNELGFDNASVRNQTRAEINEMFSEANMIKMIFVSGTHFLKENENNIKGALKRGARVQVLIARPTSEFIKDIEHMENDHMVNGARLRKKDDHIDAEILEVIDLFKDSKLELRFYDTEYRLPFKLAYYPNGMVKAWLTMSLPPYKSTQSFVLRGKRASIIEVEGLHFVEMMETHFDSVFAHALEVEDVLNEYYAYTNYKKKEAKAFENMLKAKDNNGILIEVAAQHPLIEGRFPNEEFKRRLDRAFDLYQKLCGQNEDVKIYVPGDVHYDDKISLSLAGVNYLKEKGIATRDLYGQEKNDEYSEDGVYNSSDECYVAAKIFFDEKMKELYCVCSPAQLERKALSYIRFACLPHFIAVDVDDMYHSYVDEAFFKIPTMLNERSFRQEMDKTHTERNQTT